MLGGAFFAQEVITEHKILRFFLIEIIWLQTGKDRFRRLQLVIVRLCLFISYTAEKNLINAGETILVEIGHVVCIGFINIPISNKVLNECKVFASFEYAAINLLKSQAQIKRKNAARERVVNSLWWQA